MFGCMHVCTYMCAYHLHPDEKPRIRSLLSTWLLPASGEAGSTAASVALSESDVLSPQGSRHLKARKPYLEWLLEPDSLTPL